MLLVIAFSIKDVRRRFGLFQLVLESGEPLIEIRHPVPPTRREHNTQKRTNVFFGSFVFFYC